MQGATSWANKVLGTPLRGARALRNARAALLPPNFGPKSPCPARAARRQVDVGLLPLAPAFNVAGRACANMHNLVFEGWVLARAL